MNRLIFRWIVLTVGVMAVPYLVDGIAVQGVGAALAAAAVLGILNVVVRPILILLTIPLTIFSLGFFLLFINAFVFLLADYFVSGLYVADFGSAFWAALIVSIISWALNISVQRDEGRMRFAYVGQDRDDVIDLHRTKRGLWE